MPTTTPGALDSTSTRPSACAASSPWATNAGTAPDDESVPWAPATTTDWSSARKGAHSADATDAAPESDGHATRTACATPQATATRSPTSTSTGPAA